MNKPKEKKRKAVVLLSGGLDSMLAAAILLRQNIDVIGLHLYTGLCITEHKRRTGQHDAKGRVPQNPAFKVADDLGIPLEILDISSTYLDIITKPKYGTGSGVNPCKDCRIHMFQYAEQFRQEIGADFIVTGEVIGQRPMSQVKRNLNFIHQKAGLEEIILMPLSAKLLPPTLPERNGWVNREQLYDIVGRSRKEQLRLAKEFGIQDYEQPAGGCCFLTDENYARKFKDLFQFDPDRRLDLEDVILLGVGRHFRMSERAKVVVGRYQEENAVIERHAGSRPILRAAEVMVPWPLLLVFPMFKKNN
ncbi:tRNA-specific 2-thiouridylase MnmA 2-like [Ylistrum balloti]|uniref:tRNA-specific 2-thiouridylase MnmA 2-like n=1 Tax=Ylistrum balloti TaxID=509963 RepID=UPI002905F232|nr:tRNA-specific 2-thiouridylase MnmA 2-like [Ylistrum balloti]